MKLCSQYSASFPAQSSKVLQIISQSNMVMFIRGGDPTLHVPVSILGSFLLCDKQEKLLQKATWGKKRFICLKILGHSPLYGGSHSIRSLRQLVTTPTIKHRKEHTSRLLLACGKPVSSLLTQSRALYPFKDALEQRSVWGTEEITEAVLNGWRNNSCSDVEKNRRDGNCLHGAGELTVRPRIVKEKSAG